MGDVLDNLFSIIPIVLAILWVMRRASRKKTGGKAAQTQSGSSSESSARPKPEPSRLSQRLHNLEKRATKAVRNVRDDIIGESTGERTRENPPGEEELYEQLESRRVIVPQRPAQSENTVERLVEDRSKADEEKKYSGPEISNSFDRFRELPPLAQGMVWSIILDEPPALKEPKN